jgi:flagellar hook-length control protein FliK
MISPLTVLSLLNTGSSLLTGKSLTDGILNGLENLFGGETANTANFTNILTNSTTSLNVTPQTGADGLQANGAGSLVNLDGGDALANQTIDAINDILAGNGPNNDVQVLAESNVTLQGEISSDATLNDPFGIQAAQLNGSPIAAPLAVQDAPVNNLPSDDLGADVTTGISQTQNIDTKAINLADKAHDAKLENKSLLKERMEKLAQQTDSSAVQTLKDNIFGKESKAAALKDASSLTSGADKAAERLNAVSNPHAAGLIANQFENSRTLDTTRSIRSKEDLKDKIAEMDSYKVVNVTKKDNVIDLRLEPAHLGKVQIRFDFGADGKANIAVLADRPETLEMLQKDTKTIERILADNGIKADSNSLSFNLRGQQQQSANDFNFGGRPLSFRVQEEVNKISNDNTINNAGYLNYGDSAGNGMLNIIV